MEMIWGKSRDTAIFRWYRPLGSLFQKKKQQIFFHTIDLKYTGGEEAVGDIRICTRIYATMATTLANSGADDASGNHTLYFQGCRQ